MMTCLSTTSASTCDAHPNVTVAYEGDVCPFCQAIEDLEAIRGDLCETLHDLQTLVVPLEDAISHHVRRLH